jgi:long-chain acyl-CoA synthetase
MDLKSMLAGTVERYADKTAIIFGERRVSYSELDKASNQVAHALLKMGVNRGDRVATLITNRPEFVDIYFGIVKAGGIAVPLDVRYKVNELVSLFANCQPKVLLAEGAVLEPLVPYLSRFSSIKHVVDLDAPRDGHFLGYQEIMETSPSRDVEVALEPDDIGTISYTGGPSHHPHGAALSHRNLATEAIMSRDGFCQTDKDIAVLYALPMYHMFGLASILLTAVNTGSTVAIVPGTGRSIASFLEAIERERGTIYLGVPYIYSLAINVAEREGVHNDLSSLRLWGSGGATLAPDIRRQFKKYYGADILDIWGLTEAVSHVTYHPLDGTTKSESTGKALPGFELAIADRDGSRIPPNQIGEVLVRGPIMKGYYNNPELTAEVVKDGWLHTGDIGRLDEDGYLYLAGMKKNMIILKGQNVYPRDIEEVLSSHPKIAGAIVVGIPDKLRGEIIGAVVNLKKRVTATEQEIRYFLQEHLADYKLPKQIIFTKSLLKSAREKIGKKKLEDYLPRLPSLPRVPSRRKRKSES